MDAREHRSREQPRPGRIVLDRRDPASFWLAALAELGEFTSHRFGRLTPGADSPEWSCLDEAQFDGAGAFAEILRERGAHLPRLPRLRHPARPALWRLVRGWWKCAWPARPAAWGAIEGKSGAGSAAEPPSAVAWHLFDERATVQVRRVCRRQGVSVNAFLLKNLTRAVRPFLHDESSSVPWVIPVNLRGKISRHRDTANHTSFIRTAVGPQQSTQELHEAIHRSLARAEHWANWHLLGAARFLGDSARKALLRAELGPGQRNIGTFANLGDWDADKQLGPACAGRWLFCPAVVRSRPVGAGAVTFQNQLSLAIQAHAILTTSSNMLWVWVRDWVKEIQMDVASILEDQF